MSGDYVRETGHSVDSSTPPLSGADLDYAGFFSRFIAFLIDGLLLGIATWVFPLKFQYLSLFLWFVYFPALEGSSVQATIGKRVMNLIVTDERGERLTTRTSMVRFFVGLVSRLGFLLGYAFFFFTRRKQALHDLVAGTVVLRGRRGSELPEAWLAQIRSWTQ